MKFCTACEKPLDFLEYLDGELCADCRSKQPSAVATVPAEDDLDIEALLETTLTLSEDKVELRSPEGWVLWTAGAGQQHCLRTILLRAQKIMKIRRKRSTNKP
ncbi:MAG: hypothetical protein IH612_04955 [Desulfofustis sp.]|nr:hypothetical protein [Desulfofustis sp.]